MLAYFYEIQMSFPKSASKTLSNIQSTAKYIFLRTLYSVVYAQLDGRIHTEHNWREEEQRIGLGEAFLFCYMGKRRLLPRPKQVDMNIKPQQTGFLQSCRIHIVHTKYIIQCCKIHKKFASAIYLLILLCIFEASKKIQVQKLHLKKNLKCTCFWIHFFLLKNV